MLKFRQEINYNFEDWKAIIEDKTFKKIFPKVVQSPETLVRPPKGFEESNPAIGYLKMKGFYTMNAIPGEILLSQNGLKTILENFEVSKPMIGFLNNAME